MRKEDKGKPTRFYSHRQEKQVAQSLGGTNDLQSGGGKWNKSDVIVDEWAIECKTKVTPSETIVFHKDWMKGAEKDRADMRKSYAAVCFSFGDGENYYAVDEKTFKFLLALSRGEQN